MRSIVLTVTFAAAAFAQNGQPLPSTLRRSIHQLAQQAIKTPAPRPRKLMVVVERTPCAIALGNISPDTRSRIATVPAPGKFSGREVQPPAPSCDDMKK
jgi:hypothetical protein